MTLTYIMPQPSVDQSLRQNANEMENRLREKQTTGNSFAAMIGRIKNIKSHKTLMTNPMHPCLWNLTTRLLMRTFSLRPYHQVTGTWCKKLTMNSINHYMQQKQDHPTHKLLLHSNTPITDQRGPGTKITSMNAMRDLLCRPLNPYDSRTCVYVVISVHTTLR